MSLGPFVFKPWWPSRDTLIQFVGSSGTLLAAYLGTTTTLGSVVYFLSCLVWNVIVYRGKLMGLIPLQVVGFFVACHSLWVAFAS